MAFHWNIRTERMASCDHQADALADKHDRAANPDEMLPLFCCKCHAISNHDVNLVCLSCNQHFGG